MAGYRGRGIVAFILLFAGIAGAQVEPRTSPADNQLVGLRALAVARVDMARAIRNALADQPAGAKAVEAKLVMKTNRALFKVEVLVGNELKELNLDVTDGKVLDARTETDRGKGEEEMIKVAGVARISLLDAVQVALRDNKDARVVKAQFEIESGKAVCNVNMLTTAESVRVCIDPVTGKMIRQVKLQAMAALWTFDRDKVGSMPPGWRIAETGSSKGLAKWKVVADPAGTDKGNVLALAESANKGQTFNLAIAKEPTFQNLDLQVRVRAVSGQEDQGGGPIWRCKDENNYYVCRLNPLENNFRLYYVKDGKRKQLKSEKAETKADQWYTVHVRMIGPKIECSVDGKKLLEAEDDTFTTSGKVGLWTKADAATMFDDLVVKAVE